MISAFDPFIPPTMTSIENKGYHSAVEEEITRAFEQQLKAKAQEKPVLILIGGFQGSGKTSLIHRIQQVYHTNVISTDAIRQCLLNKRIEVSPEFSKYVNHIYLELVNASLNNHSNTVIDANSHAKRIAEMEKLLKEKYPHYSIIKIYLEASEATLRNRVKSRQPHIDCYQGSEQDLEASLASTTVNLEEYDLVVDTENLSESDVFEKVKTFLFSLAFQEK